jgi:hypothetical protein
MKPFQVAIHARPAEIAAGGAVTVGTATFPVLAVPPERQAELLPVTFEDAYARLEALPNLYIELDGSFVWVSLAGSDPSWQLDGHLWDRQGRLFALDLKGVCPDSVMNDVLATLGWPTTSLMFRLIEHAVFIDEATFRKYAFA